MTRRRALTRVRNPHSDSTLHSRRGEGECRDELSERLTPPEGVSRFVTETAV